MSETETVSRIYCGLSKPDGGTVSESELGAFVDQSVSAMFPDGFTVLRAQGGWRDTASGHTIHEPSAVIEIAHGAEGQSRVMALAREYKAAFGQQAVMVTSTPVATTFA